MIRMLMHLLQLVLWAAILLGCADGSDEVRTLPAISGMRGSTVELPCEVSRPVIAVYWYRHSSTGDPAATILIQNFEKKVINNVGPRLDMTPTYSLVMRNLSVEDETTYSCHIAFVNGDTPRFFINLTVTVLADPLHPTVDHCEPTSEGECTYMVGKLMQEFELFPIVCRVNMVRPPVNLSWTSVKGDTHSEEYARRVIYVEGGFWNVSLGLKVSRYEIGRKFRCRAEGIGVNGSTEIIALIQEEPDGASAAALCDCPSVEGFIAGIVILAVAVVIVVLLGFLYHRFKARSRPYIQICQAQLTELQEIRKKISAYTPGAYATVVQASIPKETLLAVYGVAGAGRSSLINSLIYSVTDRYPSIGTGKPTLGIGVTQKSNFYRISNNIFIQDTTDLPKSTTAVSKVISTMLKAKICCPIIVISQYQDIEPYKPVFKEFVKVIIERLTFSPIFVVTRNSDDKGDSNDNRVKELITDLGGVDDRVFFLNNILEETISSDGKKAVLKVLLNLLQVADDSMVHKANDIFNNALKSH